MSSTALLSLDNIVMSNFAFYAALMVLKLFLMAFMTGIKRIAKKAFNNPEDVAAFGAKTVTMNDEDVERVRRNHLNDLENIPAFLFLGILYVLTKPNPYFAVWHFRVFAISRILHTIAYQAALPQPSRGLGFFAGFVVCISMAVQVLLAAQY